MTTVVHFSRILNENPGETIVNTANGVFSDNIVEFNTLSIALNVGPETEPETFTFADN